MHDLRVGLSQRQCADICVDEGLGSEKAREKVMGTIATPDFLIVTLRRYVSWI